MTRKSFAGLTLATLLLPALLFAQGEADLRAQIRADLMEDPRAAALPAAEFDALVDALIVKAEEEGTAATYLEGQNGFDYVALFPLPESPSALATFLASPLALALLFLAIILGALTYYIVRGKHDHKERVADMVA